ncbi:hypothetical protein Vlu01_46990 [Micromonospora lutea]|uniref:Uncharacterized protein n=1 Tax=Micromonospora lutea TaxID=419825 RepID=A0ABQ4J1Q4_9ACTN|nr:hypothetical protein Vlu01_46990 [Micromonospora lutea]
MRDGLTGGTVVGGGEAVRVALGVGLGGSVRRGDSPGTTIDGGADACRPADEARSGIGAAATGGCPGGTGWKSGPGPRYAPTATTSNATMMTTPTDTRIHGEEATAVEPRGGN